MEVTPITTSDTPFAAFLKYHKHQVVGVIPDKNDVKRRVFVFARTQETEDLLEEYYHGDPQVDPRFYYKCSTEIIKVLRENR